MTFRLLLAALTLVCFAPHPAKAADTIAEYFPTELGKAVELYEAGKFSRSLKRTRDAKKLAKKEIPEDLLHLLRALNYQKMKDIDKALAAINRSIKLRRGSSDALYLQAKLLKSKHRNREAVTAAREALWFDRFQIFSAPDAHLFVAAIMEDPEDPTAATKSLNAALKVNSKHVPSLVRLSKIERAQELKESSLGRLRLALDTEPDNAEVKLELARTLLFQADRRWDKKEIKEARSITEELIQEIDADTRPASEVFPVYVQSLIESGQITEAETQLAKVDSQLFTDLRRQLEVEKQSYSSEDSDESDSSLPK